MAAPYGLSENRLRAEAVGAIGIYATEIDCPVVRIRPGDRGGFRSSRADSGRRGAAVLARQRAEAELAALHLEQVI